MAPSSLLSLFFIPIISAQLTSPFSFSPAQPIPPPFVPPEPAVLDPNHAHHHALLRRQSSCAASYTSCSANFCCQPNTHCTTDFAGDVACCPNNAVCTGTISGPSSAPFVQTTSVAAAIGGGGITTTSTIPSPTSPSSTATVTVTVGYAAPSTANSVVTVTAAPAPTGTVANAPFPWTYIPRTFDNAGQCSSYYTDCQNTLSSCTSALGGGATAGVTVAGAGITTANSGVNPSSAASVCSSLSTVACGGLQVNLCTQYGTGGTNEAVREGGVEGMLRALGGVVVALVGGFLV